MTNNDVSKYFDDDSVGYNAAYGAPDNLRSFIFNERKKVVLDMFDVKSGKVLDIGCSPAVYTDILSARGYEIYGVDPSRGMIELAQQKRFSNAKFSVGNVEDIAFDDNFFDGILCVGVLEYLDDVEKTVKEIARVVKPDGTVIFTAPNGSSLLNKVSMHIRNALKSAHRIFKIRAVESLIDCNYEAHLIYRRKLEKILRKHGFVVSSSRFHIFRLSFLNRVSSRLAFFLTKKLNFASSPFVGINYIVKCRKVCFR